MDSVATVRRFYGHVTAGAWAEAEAMVDDDFVIYEPESLPYGGEWRGKDAFQRLFAFVMGFWRDPHIQRNGLVGDDTHVVALLTFSVTVKATGERITMPITEVTTMLPSGKIGAMRIHYFDTHALRTSLSEPAQ
jgi:hypothetical protein